MAREGCPDGCCAEGLESPQSPLAGTLQSGGSAGSGKEFSFGTTNPAALPTLPKPPPGEPPPSSQLSSDSAFGDAQSTPPQADASAVVGRPHSLEQAFCGLRAAGTSGQVRDFDVAVAAADYWPQPIPIHSWRAAPEFAHLCRLPEASVTSYWSEPSRSGSWADQAGHSPDLFGGDVSWFSRLAPHPSPGHLQVHPHALSSWHGRSLAYVSSDQMNMLPSLPVTVSTTKAAADDGHGSAAAAKSMLAVACMMLSLGGIVVFLRALFSSEL
eukprot:TRINITY_DN72765_c0_g1_i1.p1 TRINITY_DN72765_c0_g1~~TRINITY_DN72765_c0_g1_i1.p1  ORF type:complete len:270 (-),score=44.03 TRINITY_DN72765_c0_g1_i1:31-840(-)